MRSKRGLGALGLSLLLGGAAGGWLAACSDARETGEEIRDEAEDAADEVEDEIDDHT